MRRATIFFFYDPQGIVDDYIVYFLEKLSEFSERIIFCSNGPLARDAENKLNGIVQDLIIRSNVGYDSMAYKTGLELINFDREGLYDEVLMVNHTCYGPIFPFSELFTEMDGRECDFWGVSAHDAIVPNPFTGSGELPWHLNSNFIAVRAQMLRSKSFFHYWKELKTASNYAEAILFHEARFTKYFTDLGYKCSTYLNARDYGTAYPLMLAVDEVCKDRSPLLKRRSFFHDPEYFEENGADLPRALRILSQSSDYDPALIWKNVVRHSKLRDLNTNAALTSIFPDVRLKKDTAPRNYGNVAVCAHVYYVDMLEELLSLTDTIPVPYDFIATTETEEKKKNILEVVRGRKNIKNVIVRVVEQNRGRDMSALFITCRDLFLDDRYDLVCRLHTKKSPQVAALRGNLFKRHMFENLLNSEGYTTNVLDMFCDKSWVGVAVPPIVQISYWTLGHAWYTNKEKALHLRKMLDLKVEFDPNTPIGAFGTMFWFRPKAIRKLFEYPWKWSDYNAEPNHVDSGLAHVQERLICYVAQDAGYATEQIVNAHIASWNYVMMEHKLQKLGSFLPLSSFSSQINTLKNSKYLSVKGAFNQLILALKKSFEYRFPKAFKMIRPFYRIILFKK
ncbi:MAG: rhamnan synthesis F family protein [Acetobacter orientalis]|uniref:rhamnan synthesis F family protein n=1 Tax=Acetobacter orientalis TaxID=146474 RepID=UPI0039EACF81